MLTQMQEDMIDICKSQGGPPAEAILLVSELYKPEMQLEMIRWMLTNSGTNSQQRYEQCSKIRSKYHTQQDQEKIDRYWQELEEQDSEEE